LTPYFNYVIIIEKMGIQQEVEDVKRELVGLIIKHLRENKIPVDKARKLAEDFLKVLPISDQHDLVDKLKILGENYQEAKELYVDELKRVSEEKRNKTLFQMRDYIKQGDIDKAIETANILNKGD
jgi:hypothetical protein